MRNSPTGPVVRFGVFELDAETGELRKGGVLLRLQPQPAKVLALLASRPGEVVTREEIREHVWGNETFIEFDQGLNHCIKQIRAVLGDQPDAARFIQTLPKRGYRFIAPVEGAPPEPEAPKRRRPGTVLVAAVLVGLLGGAALIARLFRPDIPRIASIAVLPLENLSGDPEQEFFADGMTEELITTLGKIQALRVISRTSMMRYKRTQTPVPRIARELNVDALIEGTVLQADGRVRVTANLLHGPTDRHLWAETYERPLDDVLSLQREIARAVARQVRANLSPEEQARLARSRPVHPEAHEMYLKGQYHYYRWKKQEFAKAITYFERAIALDPDFAAAYVGLAKTYGWQWIQGSLPPEQAYPKFRAALKRALEIDDALPEAHYVQAVAAWYFYWNWEQAEAEFKRALELNPNFEEARFEYAWFLSTMGREEEAIAEAERAVEGDPLSAPANLALGSVYFVARRQDRAIAQLLNTIQLDPNDTRAYQFLAGVYEKLGLYEEAIATRKRLMVLSGARPEAIAEMEDVFRREGYEGELRWRLKRATHPYSAALIQARLGMKDEAFANLEKAYAQHWWAMVQLNRSPAWDPLRSDPRFEDLLRRMNFPR
ncbi:MAG: winged helix-turn-helix domain-containing protein [Bryobacterales bacterium]|nr:winged helix-turn-helix domain-containing protein [Bryobacterales bacterium]